MNTTSSHSAFTLTSSTGKENAFVFAVPHSGRLYPEDLKKRSALSDTELRQSEDAFVDELYEWAPTCGASLLIASYARAYLDLNRASNELDPNMFSPQLDASKLDISNRVKAGLGIIPAIVAENTYIYKTHLPAHEAEKRIADIHTPYHTTLLDILHNRRQYFGDAYLIDCHSMPSETSKLSGFSKHPDIIMGDSWGNSCKTDLTHQVEEALINEGFRVRRNVPYSGGYSTQHYGNPNRRIHALQIEINRALYMNETSYEKLANFTAVKASLESAFSSVIGANSSASISDIQTTQQKAAE